MNWLENLDSSVSLDDGKVAQLIGNRQKLTATATTANFFRQILIDFSAYGNIPLRTMRQAKRPLVSKLLLKNSHHPLRLHFYTDPETSVLVYCISNYTNKHNLILFF